MRKSRKRIAVISAAVAAVAVPAAAWAAVTLFGFGEADVAAASTQNLTVDNIQTTSALLPGGTVGAKGIVHNPNSFPVTVTDVIIRAEGAQGVGAGCDIPGTLTPKGAAADYGTGIGQGWKTHLADPVTIGANGDAKWVEIPEAVSQKVGSTVLCGFKAKVAVIATAGN